MSALCNAAYGERAEERGAARNGYRGPKLVTRLGTIRLAVPRVRPGTYLPSVLEARRRWKQAFVKGGRRGLRARRLDLTGPYCCGAASRHACAVPDRHLNLLSGGRANTPG